MGFSLCIRPTKSSSRMASASRIVCSIASHTQFYMGFALFTAGSLVTLALSHRVSHRSHSGIART
ncbi:hypothetical protein BDD12DRAFT_828153, partial [Trichophaea hybrida]